MKNEILGLSLNLYKFLLRHNSTHIIPGAIIRKLKNSQFKNKIFDVEGHLMYLNEGLFGLSIGRPFEPLVTEIVKKYIKQGSNVLDIGAHIGYYTLLFAKLVGNEGKVFAFEPNYNNFILLNKNVEMNHYRNVVSEQLAVSDRSGKAKLYMSLNPADARIYQSNKLLNYVEVTTTCLDEYFIGFNGLIDFIKMDVQGAEGAIILGMPILLKKNKNVKILTEFSPNLLSKSDIKPVDFLKLLSNHGFNIYNLNEEKMETEPTTIAELINKYPSEKEDYTNLLLVKNPIS
jgi:FkbM family methyltransferase